MEERTKAPYQNPELSIEERVEDLISRMTPLEKACQLSSAYAYGGRVDLENDLKDGIGQVGMSSGTMTVEGNAELVNSVQRFLREKTRLGIPALFHVETLNGISLTDATTYPIPLGLAATWDMDRVKEMGSQIGQEMTASGQRLALAPVLDISRDPRWGRMGETYGECPTLTSAMGTAYISGIQGESLKEGLAACAKHFLGYAASEGGLNMACSHIGTRELREVYAKPFAAAIQNAGLKGVMNCYLAVDGEPITGSKKYLTELLRGELGFEGVTVADYGSIDKLSDVFGIAGDKAAAGEMALEAGLDTEAPRRVCLGDMFVERLERGGIPMETVDVPLKRLLTLKFALGLFENPYVDVDRMKSAYHQEAHRETAYHLACESMTLLKNENAILPLQGKKRVAVVGPNADNCRALFGGYTYPAFYEGMRNMLTGMSKGMGLEGVEAQEGQRDYLKEMVSRMPDVEQVIRSGYPGVTSILEAVRKAAEELSPQTEVIYARGCGNLEADKSGFREAVELVAGSDVAVFVCGGRNGSSDGCTMGENVDSSQIGLPGVQKDLAQALLATGTPIIFVHMDGKPLSDLQAKEGAAAILEAWHPGQMGAQAIADTLFGRNNPCGKLPVTAVRHAGQIPVYAEQHRGSGVSGRGQGNNSIVQGYVDEPGFPLYPFGYGISYTEFAIAEEEVSATEMASDGRVTVTATVTNIGKAAGDEVVQLYFTDKQASVARPQKELAGFKRISLQPGESRKVAFTFGADQTAFVGSDMQWRVDAGVVELMLGNSSEQLNCVGTVKILDTRILEKGRRTYFSPAETE